MAVINVRGMPEKASKRPGEKKIAGIGYHHHTPSPATPCTYVPRRTATWPPPVHKRQEFLIIDKNVRTHPVKRKDGAGGWGTDRDTVREREAHGRKKGPAHPIIATLRLTRRFVDKGIRNDLFALFTATSPGNFSSFCHNFGIIRIYAYPFAR